MLTATMSSILPSHQQHQQQLPANDDGIDAFPAKLRAEGFSGDNLKPNDHEGNGHINQSDEEDKTKTRDLQIGNNEGALHGVVDDSNEAEECCQESSPRNEEMTSNEIISEESTPSKTQDTHKQRTRRTNVVTIQDDASTAFSPYQPISSFVAVHRPVKKKSKKKRGKTSSSKLKQKENNSNNNEMQVQSESKPEQSAKVAADTEVDTNGISPSKPQHLSNSSATATNDNHDDRDHMLQNVNDPILQDYLPKLTFLNDNYYTKVKPYGMGRRNLPQNQIELILRRRAVKKKKE